MQQIRQKLLVLQQKEADSVFLNDVQTKADELFDEYNDVTNDFTQEQEKLSKLCYLDKKVSCIHGACYQKKVLSTVSVLSD